MTLLPSSPLPPGHLLSPPQGLCTCHSLSQPPVRPAPSCHSQVTSSLVADWISSGLCPHHDTLDFLVVNIAVCPTPTPHVCSVRLTLCRAELLPERTLRVHLSPTGLVLLLPSLTGQNVREPHWPFQEALRLLFPEGNPRPAHQEGVAPWRLVLAGPVSWVSGESL